VIRDRRGNVLQLVRWSTLDDVRAYQARHHRKPDGPDYKALRKHWYVTVFDGRWLVVQHVSFLVGDVAGEVELGLRRLR
jgi:hypothetical protein